MTEQRYLFLDIDGVLNSTRYWSESGGNLPMNQAGAIDPAAVALLNRILADAPGTGVVLASSWRRQGLEKVLGMLWERGFRSDLVGATAPDPNEDADLRWERIREWLRARPHGERYRAVILDDVDGADLPGHDPSYADRVRFLQTNYLTGLTEAHARDAVAWLTKDDDPMRLFGGSSKSTEVVSMRVSSDEMLRAIPTATFDDLERMAHAHGLVFRYWSTGKSAKDRPYTSIGLECPLSKPCGVPDIEVVWEAESGPYPGATALAREAVRRLACYLKCMDGECA